jgi:hypothetical protein
MAREHRQIEARSHLPTPTLPWERVPAIFHPAIAGHTSRAEQQDGFFNKTFKKKRRTKKGELAPPAGRKAWNSSSLAFDLHYNNHFSFHFFIMGFCLKIFVARLGGTEPGREKLEILLVLWTQLLSQICLRACDCYCWECNLTTNAAWVGSARCSAAA